MGKIKTMEVEFMDEDHVFIGKKQFVSLKRFADAGAERDKILRLVADKNNELAEENKALKVLLKDKLNEEAQNEY